MKTIKSAKKRIRESKGGLFGFFKRKESGRELDLSRLGLTSPDLVELIPLLKKDFSEIERLDLGANKLTFVPEEIGDLLHLKRLNIEANELTVIPDWIGNLSNLNYLSVNNNAVTRIPQSIGNLTKLTRLYLSNNSLNDLPEELGNLKSLKVLYARNNAINALPNSIGKLNHLTDLVLTGNALSCTKGIENLRRIEFLDLEENPLSLKSIGHLSAIYNQIDRLKLDKKHRDLVKQVFKNNQENEENLDL